jgi:hypothetical protein
MSDNNSTSSSSHGRRNKRSRRRRHRRRHDENSPGGQLNNDLPVATFEEDDSEDNQIADRGPAAAAHNDPPQHVQRNSNRRENNRDTPLQDVFPVHLGSQADPPYGSCGRLLNNIKAPRAYSTEEYENLPRIGRSKELDDTEGHTIYDVLRNAFQNARSHDRREELHAIEQCALGQQDDNDSPHPRYVSVWYDAFRLGMRRMERLVNEAFPLYNLRRGTKKTSRPRRKELPPLLGRLMKRMKQDPKVKQCVLGLVQSRPRTFLLPLLYVSFAGGIDRNILEKDEFHKFSCKNITETEVGSETPRSAQGGGFAGTNNARRGTIFEYDGSSSGPRNWNTLRQRHQRPEYENPDSAEHLEGSTRLAFRKSVTDNEEWTNENLSDAQLQEISDVPSDNLTSFLYPSEEAMAQHDFETITPRDVESFLRQGVHRGECGAADRDFRPQYRKVEYSLLNRTYGQLKRPHNSLRYDTMDETIVFDNNHPEFRDLRNDDRPKRYDVWIPDRNDNTGDITDLLLMPCDGPRHLVYVVSKYDLCNDNVRREMRNFCDRAAFKVRYPYRTRPPRASERSTIVHESDASRHIFNSPLHICARGYVVIAPKGRYPTDYIRSVNLHQRRSHTLTSPHSIRQPMGKGQEPPNECQPSYDSRLRYAPYSSYYLPDSAPPRSAAQEQYYRILRYEGENERRASRYSENMRDERAQQKVREWIDENGHFKYRQAMRSSAYPDEESNISSLPSSAPGNRQRRVLLDAADDVEGKDDDDDDDDDDDYGNGNGDEHENEELEDNHHPDQHDEDHQSPHADNGGNDDDNDQRQHDMEEGERERDASVQDERVNSTNEVLRQRVKTVFAGLPQIYQIDDSERKQRFVDEIVQCVKRHEKIENPSTVSETQLYRAINVCMACSEHVVSTIEPKMRDLYFPSQLLCRSYLHKFVISELRQTTSAEPGMLDQALQSALDTVHPLSYVEHVTFRSCLQKQHSKEVIDALVQDPTLSFIKTSIMKCFGDFMSVQLDETPVDHFVTISRLMQNTNVCEKLNDHVLNMMEHPLASQLLQDRWAEYPLFVWTLLNMYIQTQTLDVSDPGTAPSLVGKSQLPPRSTISTWSYRQWFEADHFGYYFFLTYVQRSLFDEFRCYLSPGDLISRWSSYVFEGYTESLEGTSWMYGPEYNQNVQSNEQVNPDGRVYEWPPEILHRMRDESFLPVLCGKFLTDGEVIRPHILDAWNGSDEWLDSVTDAVKKWGAKILQEKMRREDDTTVCPVTAFAIRYYVLPKALVKTPAVKTQLRKIAKQVLRHWDYSTEQGEIERVVDDVILKLQSALQETVSNEEASPVSLSTIYAIVVLVVLHDTSMLTGEVQNWIQQKVQQDINPSLQDHTSSSASGGKYHQRASAPPLIWT